jgi:hypothetical protein
MVFYNGDYRGNGFGLCWFNRYWFILLGGRDSYSTQLGIINEWQHVIATGREGTIFVYVDGKPATRSVPHKPRTPAGGTVIGATIVDGKVKPDYLSFRGMIDEVMIFSRSLQEKEVARLYKCAGGPPPGNRDDT